MDMDPETQKYLDQLVFLVHDLPEEETAKSLQTWANSRDRRFVLILFASWVAAHGHTLDVVAAATYALQPFLKGESLQ